MIFRKAEKEDFDKIRSLYWNLIDQEKDDPSFPQWKKGIHPSDEMIQASIDKGELYVLADGDEIAACVIANDEKVDGYADAPWQINSDEIIVLHVLAVNPGQRGKGLARRLVENVIELERKAGRKALRLDVIENNTTAEKLYQKLGFFSFFLLRCNFVTGVDCHTHADQRAASEILVSLHQLFAACVEASCLQKQTNLRICA